MTDRKYLLQLARVRQRRARHRLPIFLAVREMHRSTCSCQVIRSSIKTPRYFALVVCGSTSFRQRTPTSGCCPLLLVKTNTLLFFAFNTRPRASSQLEREVTAKLSASDTSCAVRLAHVRAMSSANCSDDAGADSEGISLVYMENSMGPSTEPCGTPQVHPRATAAFGSRHLRFRWISSHLGVQ